MKKILLSACILATTGCMVSCIDDDNNYNYSKVNEIEGGTYNFKNISENYNLSIGQELTICPDFKFTIDKPEDMDVSYEWTVDGKKKEGADKKECTFSFDECGTHTISFYVIDNKSGLKYGITSTVKVMSEFQRGWTILSKGDDGRAVLNFIIPNSMKYDTKYNNEDLKRDSIIYNSLKLDVNKNLGMNPTGLTLAIGEADYYDSFGIDEYDELVVRGDKWEELNGKSLQHETYTIEEFGDDVPENFKPVECSYTWSMKAVRSEDGYIYCNVKPDASDFHIGTFTNVPINNGMKFKRLFPFYKYGGTYCQTMLALSEDNSLMAIVDAGRTNSYSNSAAISENSRRQSGDVYEVVNDTEQDYSFTNMEDEIVDLRPATCSMEADFDYSYPPQWFVALTKNPSTGMYSLLNCHIEANYTYDPLAYITDIYVRPFGFISDFKDMAVFQNKHYVMIADGNKLYYCQYGADPNSYEELLGDRILVKTFDHDIISLDANDVQNDPYKQKYDYPGQLGVALDNGEFYIFSVIEQEDDWGNCEAVNLKQEFPNDQVKNNNFGKIVDVLYKVGRATEQFIYQF